MSYVALFKCDTLFSDLTTNVDSRIQNIHTLLGPLVYKEITLDEDNPTGFINISTPEKDQAGTAIRPGGFFMAWVYDKNDYGKQIIIFGWRPGSGGAIRFTSFGGKYLSAEDAATSGNINITITGGSGSYAYYKMKMN